MKGVIYFILFFALSICWYLLASISDNAAPMSQIVEVQPINESSQNMIDVNQELNNTFETFKELLDQKKWVAALDLYRNNFDRFSVLEGVNANNHPLKVQLINTMLFLSSSNDQNELNTLVNYALTFYGQDSDFIQIKINALIGQGEVNQALDLYFTKVNQFTDEEEKLLFKAHFDQWLEKQLLVWHSNSLDGTIERVWQKLVKFDSENIKWQVQLAQSFVWQQKYKQALSVLEPIQFNWDYQNQISELMQVIQLNNHQDGIQLEKVGSHFLVDTVFVDNKISPDNVSVKLLIDTGASFSVIDEQTFNDVFFYLDTKKTKTVTAKTANGTVDAQMYEVSKMQIGEFVVNDMAFIVMDLPEDETGVQGLLGMNFLQNFKFSIDQDTSRLNLSH